MEDEKEKLSMKDTNESTDKVGPAPAITLRDISSVLGPAWAFGQSRRRRAEHYRRRRQPCPRALTG